MDCLPLVGRQSNGDGPGVVCVPRTISAPGCSGGMLNLFKRKTPRNKLETEYRRLLAEAHRLSTINRAASDQKRAEAEAVLVKMDRLAKEAGA